MRRREQPNILTSINGSILVIGSRNSGKTSFVKLLQQSLALPPYKHPSPPPEGMVSSAQHSNQDGFCSQYVEGEFDGERVGLTLWDSDGLDRNVVDIQLRGIVGFLEGKFQDTLAEEIRVVRSPQVRDTHIHCAILLLDPVNLDRNIAAAKRAAQGKSRTTDPRLVGILDAEMDVQVLRAIHGKTTVVPVIAKADMVTTSHMGHLKMAVWDSLKKAKIDPLETLALEEQDSDEEDAPGDSDNEEEYKSPPEGSIIPFSILSPDPETIESGDNAGRRFPWGFSDPYDSGHCDFVSLKESVFSEWRNELRTACREICYERWRTNLLDRKGSLSPDPQIAAATRGLRLSNEN